MESKTKIDLMMGQGAERGLTNSKRSKGRVAVTEHRNTGRVHQSEPPLAADHGTIESRRAERAAAKAARRARRQSDTFNRADQPPVLLTDIKVAAHLADLADKSARAYIRRREAMDGREIVSSHAEEITAIYHAAFARAVVRAGVCPGSRAALYIARSNPLPFGALRAWIQATREAASQARSYLWGHGAERRDSVSIDAPATPAALADLAAYFAGHGPGEPPTATDVIQAAADDGDGATERCRTSPQLRAHLRQHIRHYSDCLRVFWTMSGSRKSAAGLREDLRILAAAARITRAGGVERLPEKYIGDGQRAPGALKMALCRLREHVASGDVLTTEQPEAAELIVSLARRHRREAKYQMPPWMLVDAPQVDAAPAAAIVAPSMVPTFTLQIPAPASVGVDSRGLGLFWLRGRVCTIGGHGARAVSRPDLTAYALAVMGRA